MRYQDLKMRNKVLTASLAPLSLLLILVLISVLTINTLLESAKWVDHTHKVLDKTSDIATSAVNMETGMRGFLLTGKEHFLEPYNIGVASAFKTIEDLKKTVSDNPPQVQRLERVRSVLERWNLNVAEQNIALRREIGGAANVNDLAIMTTKGEGKAIFDSFRGKLRAFINQEKINLKQRHTEFGSTIRDSALNFENVISEFGEVHNIHEVLDSAALLLNSALRMETGIRGYFLSGNEEILAPYYAAVDRFNDLVAKIKILILDNPSLTVKLDFAAKTIDEWVINFAQPAIALRREVNNGSKQFSQALKFLEKESVKGKQVFDKFHVGINSFIEEELRVLAQHEKYVVAAKDKFKLANTVLVENEELVTQTNDAIRKAYILLSSAIDMETGMRGYLLSGSDPFLEPYNSVAANFSTNVEELKIVIIDSPTQLQLLGEINALIVEWKQKIAEPMIEHRRRISDARTMEDLAHIIETERGREYFEEFRQALSEFRIVEEDLLSQRAAENDDDIKFAFFTIGLTLLIAIVIGSGFGVFVGRGIAKPVNKLTDAMKILASGDTDIDVPGRDRKDELGGMAETVEVFKDNLIENLRLQEQSDKAREALEEQSAELERSNQELENFAYVASHDLKAPLRGISNLSKWVSDDLGEDVDEEISENLELMQSRVLRLEGLLDGLLEYSRVGRGEHKPEEVETSELISEVSEYLSPPQGCEIKIDGELPVFTTQKIPLEQVFRNLVGNAIKHRDKDDLRIVVSGKRENGFCTFEVSDNGPGIPEKYHERIFLMFQTLKPRDEVEASGMGLAMVKKLIEYNGGAIFLESDPEKRNTVFRFTWK